MKFYAKIKKSSKYHYQDAWAKKDQRLYGGYPFPVEIVVDRIHGESKVADDYAVQGGPGGQYCLRDVQLFVERSNGKLVRLT